jgi:hypothetical protein
MSIESFDKVLVLVGPRITYENTRLHLSVPPQERLAVTQSKKILIFAYYCISGGPGSSVGIATDYGLDGPEIESR